MTHDKDVFSLLKTYEARAKQIPKPQDNQTKATFTGVGFKLAEHYLVSPLKFIREIVSVPELTRFFRSKPWLKGLANVRGELIPVTDLTLFFAYPQKKINDNFRIIILDDNKTQAGLMVEHVFGMKRFSKEQESPLKETNNTLLNPFLSNIYNENKIAWVRFEASMLMASPTFFQVNA